MPHPKNTRWPTVGALKLSYPVSGTGSATSESLDDETPLVNLVYGKFQLASSPLVELAVLSAWNVVRYAQLERVPLPEVNEFRSLVIEEDSKRTTPIIAEGKHQGVGIVRLEMPLEKDGEITTLGKGANREEILKLLEETARDVALLIGVQRVMIELFSDRRSYRVDEDEIHPIV